MRSPELFRALEQYYDEVPRASARTEEIGPFTLFVKRDPEGWPFYARPRLGADVPITAVDLEAVRQRQKELGILQSFEWVHETSPSLLKASRQAGLHVDECPLLVLPRAALPLPSAGPEVNGVSLMDPQASDLGDVLGAIGAGFAQTDAFAPKDPRGLPQLMRDGLLVVAGAYDERGATGGGSHSPRGSTTELTGIAVIPRARRRGVGAAITQTLVSDARARRVETVFLSAQENAVARVYERVGFVRIGTACIAEALDASEPGNAPAVTMSEEPVEIRLVGGDEWEAWRDIRLRALRDSPTAFASTYEREIALAKSDYRDMLGASGPVVIAMVGGQPAGMGAGHRDVEGWLRVVAMWVDPARRGSGVGRRVLDEIVAWADENGLRAHLDVTVGNSPARMFYERHGFVGTGETRPLRPGSPHLVERMVRARPG